uniref:Zeta_toxin domain-containing protein n=1 Tax=Strongyloides venezuelensis TaxID=75913 RepID=A0A0K0FRT0_STRVS
MSYIDNAIDAVHDSMKITLYGYTQSFKSHCISHYKDMIMELGHPYYLNTIRFESSNKVVKDCSRISKCKKTLLKTTLGKLLFFNKCGSRLSYIGEDAIDTTKKEWSYHFGETSIKDNFKTIFNNKYSTIEDVINTLKTEYIRLKDGKKISINI